MVNAAQSLVAIAHPLRNLSAHRTPARGSQESLSALYLSALHPGETTMSMQSDDMEAIDRYMKETKRVTSKANKLHDEWIVWYDGLGWYDLNFNTDIFDQARNRKNAFNLANVHTDAERDSLKEQIKNSFTTEEARGQPNRMKTDGAFNEAPDTEPFFPTRVKVAGGIAALGFGALWALKKIYVDPFIGRKR